MPERSTVDAQLATIPGMVPGLYDRPSGCLFAPRCTYTTAHCRARRPELRDWAGGRVRCHYPLGDPQRDTARARDGAMETERS
jgi:dipeptide transport system ATP-binding protein